MSAKLIERRGVVIDAASGDEFRHNGTAAGRKAAVAKATARQREYLKDAPAPANHPETRSSTPEPGLHSTELSRAKTIFFRGKDEKNTINPFKDRFATRRARLGELWARSPSGQEYKLQMEAASERWENSQDDAHADGVRRELVEPMAQHALKTLAQAEATDGIDVATLEQLRANVVAIRNGTMTAEQYKVADKSYREARRAVIEAKAHKNDDTIRTLAGERSALLAEAWGDAEPVPTPKLPEPDQRVTGEEAARLNRQYAETQERIKNGELRMAKDTTLRNVY